MTTEAEIQDQFDKLTQLYDPNVKLLPALKKCRGVDPYTGFVCIKHPLVYSICHTLHINNLVNQQYLYKKKALQEATAEGNWNSYIWLHERPYRFNALARIAKRMPDRAFWELLSSVISDSENIWQVKHILKRLINSKRPEKAALMDAEEHSWFARLPERFVVYRGYSLDDAKKGWSWSLSYRTAKWFAQRYSKNGKVSRGIVHKKHVHAVILGRKESEIVVDPRNVILSPIKSQEKPAWLQNIIDLALKAFPLGNASHHGPWHWEQVARNCKAISRVLRREGVRINNNLLTLFAYLHDCKRENEYDDPKHGERAADFVLHLHRLNEFPLSHDEVRILADACNYHNTGQVSDNPIIDAMWAADRLDLARCSIFPEEKYFGNKNIYKLLFQV